MRAIVLLGALCVAALGCARTGVDGPRVQAPEDEPKARTAEDDLKALQGTWQIVSALDRGKPVPAEFTQRDEYEFRGNALVTHEYGQEKAPTPFTLDTTQSPRVMRLAKPEHWVVEAIYEIRGDTLRFAFVKSGHGRPTAFDVDPQGEIRSIVFKRKK